MGAGKSTLRITGGELRGRRFSLPPDVSVRPTSERVREAMFSMLLSRCDFAGKTVLDLYAGSGALGMEAISRGASFAVFVEQQSVLVRTLKDTLSRFGIADRGRVVGEQVMASLKATPGLLRGFPEQAIDEGKPAFDIVFADPPYGEHPAARLVSAVLDAGLVREGSLFVLESATRDQLEMLPQGGSSGLLVAMVKDKEYGDTRVQLLECVRASEVP